MIVVSHHGFKVAPRVVRPNVLLRQAGLLQVQGTAVTCDAYVLSEGGTAMVYVTDHARTGELRPRLKALFSRVEGISEVRDRADFPRLGMPDPDKNTQMADLMLIAAEGYGFGVETEGDPVATLPNATTGRHGYVSSDPDMNAIFIASGYGIKPGARPGQIANVDVAPTIASLLGFTMGGIEGRRLDAVLNQPSPSPSFTDADPCRPRPFHFLLAAAFRRGFEEVRCPHHPSLKRSASQELPARRLRCPGRPRRVAWLEPAARGARWSVGQRKSTLLHLIGCLDRPTRRDPPGELRVPHAAREARRDPARSPGLAFQTFNSCPS